MPLVHRRTALWTLAATGMGPASAADLTKLIVPGPPGGTLDVVAQWLAASLKRDGVLAVPDYHSGGLGTLGVHTLLKAPLDGRALLIHINGIVTEVPAVSPQRYDPHRDIHPLAELARGGLVLVVPSSPPIRRFADLGPWARGLGREVLAANYGQGTTSSWLPEQLAKQQGWRVNTIAYRGSPPALQELLGGHTDLMFDAPLTSLPHIRAGTLRALAVTTPQRLPALPEVPTLAELGLPTLTRTVWLGAWVQAGLPEAHRATWRAALRRAFDTPEARERWARFGMQPGDLTLGTEALQQRLRREALPPN